MHSLSRPPVDHLSLGRDQGDDPPPVARGVKLPAILPALTLTQPWASLVAIGAKQIETRSCALGCRARSPFTRPKDAAKGLGPVGGMRGLCELLFHQPFNSVFVQAIKDGHFGYPLQDHLPYGAVIAVCKLSHVRPTSGAGGGWVKDLSDQERAFGDYSPYRYGFHLAEVHALPEPVPARGSLGLWDWTLPDGFRFPSGGGYDHLIPSESAHPM